MKLINSKDHGLPQQRTRLFIFGLKRRQLRGRFQWPQALPPVPASSVLDPQPAGWSTSHAVLPTSAKQCERLENAIDLIVQAAGAEALKRDIFIDCDSSPKFGTPITIDYAGCITRTRAGSGGPFVTSRMRRTNLKEIMRLQGFVGRASLKVRGVPERQVRLCLGNAWSVNVAARILHAIVKCMKFGKPCEEKVQDPWCIGS